MGRCNNIATNKISLGKLSDVEVSFTVVNDLDSCVTINTKNGELPNGETAVYDPFTIPADLLNCDTTKCINTGTLLIDSEKGEEGGSEVTTSVKFAKNVDARDFAAGVVTMYVKAPKAGTYGVDVTISDITNTTQDKSYIYKTTIIAIDDGFYPVVIDLSKCPDEKEGAGWEVTDLGVLLTVSITAEGVTNSLQYGVSSIAIFDSIEDLEASDVVKVGCLDDFTGEVTVDPVDATCFGTGYDASSIAIERSLTGKSVTPNYWKLNPIMSKGDKADGWYIATEEKEVQEVTIDGITYGAVQTRDMYVEECAFAHASLSDNCHVTEAMLNKVHSPMLIDLNQKQFMVLDGQRTSAMDAGKFLFHKSLIGKNVTVSYPKKTEVEHFIASDAALADKRVKMTFAVKQSDGVTQQYVYNNVLITSFPMSLSNEEHTFEFTINIQRDANRRFFEMYRIANAE